MSNLIMTVDELFDYINQRKDDDFLLNVALPDEDELEGDVLDEQ